MLYTSAENAWKQISNRGIYAFVKSNNTDDGTSRHFMLGWSAHEHVVQAHPHVQRAKEIK
jgi:hypothetical protein